MLTVRKALLALALVVVGFSVAGAGAGAPAGDGPTFAGKRLAFPNGYREWIYVTSGFDMSYSPAMSMGGSHTFDNVFVNPSAYRSFVETGRWPDGTALVLEHRTARTKGSINRSGSFQTSASDIEVHVRDHTRFAGGWGFFAFSPGDASSAMIPRTVACYACHAQHAAVDTTFVQFYPTLAAIARAKGSFRR